MTTETSTGGDEKRSQTQALLSGILERMEYPATLDFKDMPDGGIGVAVHFDGALPGITPGKRSFLVDSLQFLLNKAINRPQHPKRWISLGVNAFPEPRPPRPEGTQGGGANAGAPQASPSAPAAAAPKASAPQAQTKGNVQGQGQGKPAQNGQHGKPQGQPAPQKGATPQGTKAHERGHDKPRRAEADEASLAPAEDANVTRLATLLAQKSAAKGRTYGVMLLSPDDRARMLKAAAAVPGQRVKVEGEGHFRRVVFVSEKPVPMPKKAPMPDFDDEEE